MGRREGAFHYQGVKFFQSVGCVVVAELDTAVCHPAPVLRRTKHLVADPRRNPGSDHCICACNASRYCRSHETRTSYTQDKPTTGRAHGQRGGGIRRGIVSSWMLPGHLSDDVVAEREVVMSRQLGSIGISRCCGGNVFWRRSAENATHR